MRLWYRNKALATESLRLQVGIDSKDCRMVHGRPDSYGWRWDTDLAYSMAHLGYEKQRRLLRRSI